MLIVHHYSFITFITGNLTAFPHCTRAITLSVQMRSGEQIGNFGTAIDATLADLKKRLPEDLLMARTSDQSCRSKTPVTDLQEVISFICPGELRREQCRRDADTVSLGLMGWGKKDS